jgi:hypothetical protein
MGNIIETINRLFTEISYHNIKIESMSKSNKRNLLISLRNKKIITLRKLTDRLYNKPIYRQEETIL